MGKGEMRIIQVLIPENVADLLNLTYSHLSTKQKGKWYYYPHRAWFTLVLRRCKLILHSRVKSAPIEAVVRRLHYDRVH